MLLLVVDDGGQGERLAGCDGIAGVELLRIERDGTIGIIAQVKREYLGEFLYCVVALERAEISVELGDGDADFYPRRRALRSDRLRDPDVDEVVTDQSFV